MRLSLIVLIALVAHDAAALRVTPGSTNIGRRGAVLAAVPALFAATTPAFGSTVGAAPTPEDEAKFDEILKAKLADKEKQFAAMGETLDKEDIEAVSPRERTRCSHRVRMSGSARCRLRMRLRTDTRAVACPRQTEYLLRTSLCGFQAKLKCKGSGKPPK